ncbi:putative transferase CAF17 homolog, mitochondrial [Astyanax mexicanus]|uniref:putative transferase CAF17 homolog, mitochondrial n=1 Tax=Astyanax mexicanus TaxID=7994 RepID=UPI0020CABEEE|nr:putative transferase CAF17 homolog, mitochondrial [Astyanax mexicanus]
MRAGVLIRAGVAGRLCGLSRPAVTLRWIRSSSGPPENPARDQSAAAPLRCFRLPGRSLLHIRGPDTCAYLQGIITNDMNLLQEEEERRALYAHMLNVQGRTLYDIIIYSVREPSGDPVEVLLECDGSVLDSVTRHLKVYKIRRRVTVTPRSDLALWALLPRDAGSARDGSQPRPTAAGRPLVLVPDPRTDLMGWRMITGSSENPAELLTDCENRETEEYQQHRYTIGLPEGVADLPPGDALPLESNLVFMNGISFSKGCYIGQELTARTHHTGVVRKRLLPLSLSAAGDALLPGGALDSTAAGKPAGKLRAGLGRQGLGLVRLAHANDTLTLKSSSSTPVTARASIPDWWPKDATK